MKKKDKNKNKKKGKQLLRNEKKQNADVDGWDKDKRAREESPPPSRKKVKKEEDSISGASAAKVNKSGYGSSPKSEMLDESEAMAESDDNEGDEHEGEEHKGEEREGEEDAWWEDDESESESESGEKTKTLSCSLGKDTNNTSAIIENSEVRIYHIDVATGDATFIRYIPFTKEGNPIEKGVINVLIDGGYYSFGQRVLSLIEALNDPPVKKLHMISTHMDADHAGGLRYLLQNKTFAKLKFYYPKKGRYADAVAVKKGNKGNKFVTADDEATGLQIILSELGQKTARSIPVKKGKVIAECKDRFKLTVIASGEDGPPFNDNYNSIGLALTHGNFSHYIAGDLPSEIEDSLGTEVPVDHFCAIKATHHGSKHHTSENFLNKWKPSHVFISCGRKHDHPDHETIMRLHQCEHVKKFYLTNCCPNRYGVNLDFHEQQNRLLDEAAKKYCALPIFDELFKHVSWDKKTEGERKFIETCINKFFQDKKLNAEEEMEEDTGESNNNNTAKFSKKLLLAIKNYKAEKEKLELEDMKSKKDKIKGEALATETMLGTSLLIHQLGNCAFHGYDDIVQLKCEQGHTVNYYHKVNLYKREGKNEKFVSDKLKSHPSGFIDDRLFDNLGTAYIRYDVLGDGNCGYTALGFTRDQAFSELNENREKIKGVIADAVKEALLSAGFRDYLFNGGMGDIYEQITEKGEAELANNNTIVAAYICYDVRDKNIDGGWAHPCVLRALAEIKNIELYLWCPGSEKNLIIPHLYHHYSPSQKVENRVDLLFINKNHFDRLEIEDSDEYSNQSESKPVLDDVEKNGETAEDQKIIVEGDDNQVQEDDENVTKEGFAFPGQFNKWPSRRSALPKAENKQVALEKALKKIIPNDEQCRAYIVKKIASKKSLDESLQDLSKEVSDAFSIELDKVFHDEMKDEDKEVFDLNSEDKEAVKAAKEAWLNWANEGAKKQIDDYEAWWEEDNQQDDSDDSDYLGNDSDSEG